MTVAGRGSAEALAELQDATDLTYDEDGLPRKPFPRVVAAWCRTCTSLDAGDQRLDFDEYLDALFYRARLARIAARISSEPSKTAWSEFVGPCDELFRAATRDNGAPLVVDEEDWWWTRIPRVLPESFAKVLRGRGT